MKWKSIRTRRNFALGQSVSRSSTLQRGGTLDVEGGALRRRSQRVCAPACAYAIRTLTVFFLLLTLFATSAEALLVRMEGDRLWLHAEDQPLSSVLASFVHAGVRVQLDPAIQDRISLRLDGVDLEHGLNRLLGPYGYVVSWRVIHGPLGPLPHLNEIQVFRPGNREHMRPLEGEGTVLRVARSADGTGPEFIEDELLIGFSPDVDMNAIRLLLREIGGTIIDGSPELGIYRIRLPPGTNIPALRDQLDQHPAVAAVEPNYAYRMPPPVTTGGEGTSGREAVVRYPGAPAPGSPSVAVLDSGLQMLSGMEGLVTGGLDALNPGQALSDLSGHGTQMALLASGTVAPSGYERAADASGVPILAIRAFDDNGVASNFGIMRSILFATEQGARVINMSWGSEVSSPFLQDAISFAMSREIVVVAAAGNEPLNRPVYPAAYPGVVGVGAVDANGRVWEQSNYGTFITVSAPGVARLPVGHRGPAGDYAGTSISSAVVSHALGSYFVQNPTNTRAEALRALVTSVRENPSAPRNLHTGYGVLNAQTTQRLLGR